ncbi:hypothetical protein M422DRAFT_205787, partial [Sphaerobolus stellatus SS14]
MVMRSGEHSALAGIPMENQGQFARDHTDVPKRSGVDKTECVSSGVRRSLWTGVKEILRAVERVSEVFPPFKSAVAGFLEVIDRIEAIKSVSTQLYELRGQLEKLEVVLRKYEGRTWMDLNDPLYGLVRVFEVKKASLETKLDRSMLSCVIECTDDKEYILQELISIGFAVEIFMMDTNLNTHHLVSSMNTVVNKLQNNCMYHVFQTNIGTNSIVAVLDRLGLVSGAEYNHENRQACMPGTRIVLLADLLTWAMDPNTHRILWLNGMAGTGKTTVAESFSRFLAQKQMLGASFFCSRQSQDRSDVRNIFPSLARSLAAEIPAYREELIKILDSHTDPRGINLQDQYQYLIVKPLEAIGPATVKNLVLSIDALDECEDKERTMEFIRIILECIGPSSLRFFLTGRPDLAIREGFRDARHKQLRLHDIEDHIVEADIRIYLTKSLEGVKWFHGMYAAHWPPQEINMLAKQAGKLFIYAATVYKFLKKPKGIPSHRLKALQALNSSVEATKTIDKLYEVVLSEAFNELDRDEEQLIKEGLKILVCSRQPLSISSYSTLLGMQQYDIIALFASLHSVVHISEDKDAVVAIYHASFSDYLTSPERSGVKQLGKQGPEPWHFGMQDGHLTLSTKCLDLMMSQLGFNIVNITTSHSSNDLQPTPISVPAFPLVYACTTWGNHFILAKEASNSIDIDFLQKIESFLRKRFLYWLEVLSVMKKVQYASALLHTILKVCSSLQSICKDFTEFIDIFRETIEYNAAHIYLSALPFARSDSQVSLIYLPQFPNLSFVQGTSDTLPKQNEILRFKAHTSDVSSVAFSPDGQYIVSGSHDKTVRLWNIQTGEAVGMPFEAHTEWVTSVAFSPDGKYVVSGSYDKTMRLWGVPSGDHIGKPFQGHTAHVHAVAFSPEGLYLVSGDSDGTIHLRSVQTSEVIKSFGGQTWGVNSLVFSPDGCLIVSGSKDIRIWSVQTGEITQGQRKSHKGHTGNVSSVVFSPDGQYIASGSADTTIQVWSLITWKAVGRPLEGHAGCVKAVTFSPDGQYIASGSNDMTVRLWSVQTGGSQHLPEYIVSASHDRTLYLWNLQSGKAVKMFQGHTKSISSVAFSPDGHYIVSGSDDKTVCLWSVNTGKAMRHPLQGHTDSIHSVGFSLDGQYIISGSYDRTIRFWNTQTGEAVGKPLKGPTVYNSTVSISADGQYTVSGFHDTVCLWNVQTGEAVGKPFRGHTDYVHSVAFSSDVQYIVSGSSDRTVRLWSVQTGEAVGNPFRGHTGCVRSVAFSPDGKYIASGSSDKTVRLWSVQTGDAVGHPFQGHRDYVRAVAFSPDGQYVLSGSSDRTVRLWNVDTAKS